MVKKMSGKRDKSWKKEWLRAEPCRQELEREGEHGRQ
jgi:hypothetical protein